MKSTLEQKSANRMQELGLAVERLRKKLNQLNLELRSMEQAGACRATAQEHAPGLNEREKGMNQDQEIERLRKRVVELERLIHNTIPFVGYEATVEDLKAELESAVDYPFRYSEPGAK